MKERRGGGRPLSSHLVLSLGVRPHTCLTTNIDQSRSEPSGRSKGRGGMTEQPPACTYPHMPACKYSSMLHPNRAHACHMRNAFSFSHYGIAYPQAYFSSHPQFKTQSPVSARPPSYTCTRLTACLSTLHFLFGSRTRIVLHTHRNTSAQKT